MIMFVKFWHVTRTLLFFDASFATITRNLRAEMFLTIHRAFAPNHAANVTEEHRRAEEHATLVLEHF